MHTLLEILNQSWQLVLQAAPFLLLGFVIAGLLHAFMPTEWLVRWLGAASWRSVLNAALIGTPLPLCSCSVLPVADALRKRGASRGATTAFLISTPESGVESIAITYALMDPVMTIARPVSAMLTAFSAGIAQNLWSGDEPASENAHHSHAASDCHAGATSAAQDRSTDSEPGEAAPSCCCEAGAVTPNGEAAPDGTAAPDRKPLSARLLGGLRYGLVDMFEDLASYFVVGFLIAGVLAVVLREYDPVRLALGSAWAPLIMLLAGIPMYVCASAATPMVAVLISQGLSPGAGLIFLLAGPATNAASLVVLRRTLGRRALAIYLIAIMLCALAAGFALDGVYALSGLQPQALVRAHADHGGHSWVDLVSALALMALIAYGLWRRYGKRLVSGKTTTPSSD